MPATLYAYVYRGGILEIGENVPEGALEICRGGVPMRRWMEANARHAYDGVTLLVPGIPEAESEDEAHKALIAFRKRWRDLEDGARMSTRKLRSEPSFRVLALMAQKGGAGKTTLAVHLAVAAALAGEIVELIDCDPQGSAAMWSAARAGKPPIVLQADPADLPRLLADAKRRGVTFVVVDTAPRMDTHAMRAAQFADFILSPCRPSAFDFGAAFASASIIKKSGTPAAFVLSSCPFRAPEIAETRGVLAQHAIEVCPVEIIERRDYARAIPSGEAVAEFAPRGKAAAEMAALWKFTQEAMRHVQQASR